MNIVNAGYKLIEEEDPIKKIERIARVCYKSEDKIGEGTDIKMVRSLIERQHLAMLEHASLAFQVDAKTYYRWLHIIEELTTEPLVSRSCKKCYLRFSHVPDRYIISGNLRAWLETFQELSRTHVSLQYAFITEIGRLTKGLIDFNPGGCGEDVYQYITDFTQLTYEERLIHETLSVLFTVDRGVTHELVRMRDCSFAQESTRYCNYNLGKFGNEITVIRPCFWEDTSPSFSIWADACAKAEEAYFKLLAAGAKPQEARDVLPTSVKADIVVTTEIAEWQHIFALRACDATGPAHPQMKEVMVPLLKNRQEVMPKMFLTNLLCIKEE